MMLAFSKNIIKVFLGLVVFLILSIPFVTSAQFNSQINYQGKLTDSSGVAVPDGLYNMNFWLIASDVAATSTAVWSESLTGGNRVQVTNGLFSVMLGEQSSLDSVDFNQTLYLGVEIGGTSVGTPTWDGEMSPRKVLGAVPAAFEAENAQTLDGIATSSFVRSDEADTVSGLLTFSGGLISTASSTISNLTTNIATTTTLVINNQAFTNLLGLGLTNQSGVLTVSTTTLGFGTLAALNSVDISSNTNLSVSATGLQLSGDDISLTAGYNIPLTASTTNWNNTYNTVTAGSASWNAAAASTTALTPTYIRGLFTGGTGVTLTTGDISFDCSEVEGTGINCSGEAITLDATGDWTGTFDGQDGTYYLSRANHSGTQLASTISDFSTTARGLFSSSATGLTYTSGTGAFSLTAGYNIPLTASTTEWHNKVGSQWTTNGSDIYYSSGNIGIGTSTPNGKLHTYTNSSSEVTFESSYNGYSAMLITHNSAGVNLHATGGAGGTPGSFVFNTGSSYEDPFGTSAKMILTEEGRLGIGTTTPSATLHVQNQSGSTELTVEAIVGDDAIFNLKSDTANEISFSNLAGSNTAKISHDVSANLSFTTSGGGLVKLMSGTGNFGIGTSTPAELFTVTGTSSVRNILPETNLIYSLGSTAKRFNEGWISTLNVGTSTWSITQSSNGRFSLFDAASGGGTERLSVLSSSGYVGIGSTNPGAKLEVVGDIISKGTEWTSRTSTTTNSWKSVTYGNGLFVAVSYDGTGNRVMTSPDGITWTSRTSAADNAWYSVTYGNGMFVAVAGSGTGNRVMTSSDGITWTSRTSAADNSWNSVTYGNGLFVAVSSSGTGNRVMTSPDGITWTSRTSAADNSWYSVTYGNGLFVAVSYTGTGNRVMTSPDGITWTSRTSAADNSWYSVTYGNGLFVAVSLTGTNNRVMTSPDGITWTSRTSAADNGWTSVTYGNGLFVAVSYTGTGNRVMTSPDGITWTSRTSAADNQWYGVTYSNGIFVAVAISGTGNRVMTSGKTEISALAHNNLYQGGMSIFGNVGVGTSNPGAKLEVVGDIISKGTEWTSRTSAGDYNWQSVAYGNGLFVAFSYDYKIMISPDGINWTISGTPSEVSYTSITYGNGLFVAVSNYGGLSSVATSPDGVSWTSRTAASTNAWQSVTYGEGLFVAVANSGTGNRVMTSPDGITWTSRTSAADNSWTSVTYGNGLFVAVAASGTGNRVMTSPNGITWTSRTSAADNSWTSVTYGNGLFVAVAASGTGNRVMTSPDGITWTSRTSAADNQWYEVTYGNGLFVAVASDGTGNRVMTSPDGTTWTTRTSAADNAWQSIIYGNGLFVAVAGSGTGNRVMTSGKTEISALAHNNLYQGGMNILGNVGIGTTSPQRAFHVQITTDAPPVRFQDSNGYCEINPTSATWTCTSDRRLKENIETLSRPEILSGINALRSVSFSWISDKNSRTQTGFIAQEVEEIFPELVATDPQTGYKSVGYGGFTPYLVASIQEIDSILGSPTASSTTGQSFSESIIFGKIVAAFEYIGLQIRDSILTVAGINVNRVEVSEEFCVDGVCIDAGEFRALLETVDNTSSPVVQEEIIDNIEESDDGPISGQESEGSDTSEIAVDGTEVTENEEVSDEQISESEITEPESTESETAQEAEEVLPEPGPGTEPVAESGV